MNKLEYHRKKIDAIDRNIVKFLLLRFKTAKRISYYKKADKIKISDKKRELQVLSNVKTCSNKRHQKFIESVFKNIIQYSKKIQLK